MIKTLKKIVIWRYFLNMKTDTHTTHTHMHACTDTQIHTIHHYSTVSHLLNWETLKAYPGSKQAYPSTTI